MANDQLPLHAPHAFLDGLDQRHRDLMAVGARPFAATAGEIIGAEGSEANRFILIQQGHVGLWQHCPGKGTIPIQTLGPGEVVGWSWLLPPYRWQFDCRAVDEVRGQQIDANWLREQCEKDSDFGYRIVKRLVAVLAERLAATRLQLLDIYK